MRPPFHRHRVVRAVAVACVLPPEPPRDEIALAVRHLGRAIARGASRGDWARGAASAGASLIVALLAARVGLGGGASWLAELVGTSVALPLACVLGALLVRGVERVVAHGTRRAAPANVRRGARTAR